MTGPTIVALSSGSPTFMWPAAALRPATTSSSLDRCTIARVGAVQIWPEWKPHTLASAVTTFLTSASSKTTAAPLPPSSMRLRFIVRAHSVWIATPTPEEPVKLTMSTSSEATRAWPASAPEPVTMLTTPSGMPSS